MIYIWISIFMIYIRGSWCRLACLRPSNLNLINNNYNNYTFTKLNALHNNKSIIGKTQIYSIKTGKYLINYQKFNNANPFKNRIILNCIIIIIIKNANKPKGLNNKIITYYIESFKNSRVFQNINKLNQDQNNLKKL